MQRYRKYHLFELINNCLKLKRTNEMKRLKIHNLYLNEYNIITMQITKVIFDMFFYEHGEHPKLIVVMTHEFIITVCS